jgi:hypothetical protein
MAANDYSTAQTQGLKHMGDGLAQLRSRNADKLCGRPGGIQQRTEEIEDGSFSAFRA